MQRPHAGTGSPYAIRVPHGTVVVKKDMNVLNIGGGNKPGIANKVTIAHNLFVKEGSPPCGNPDGVVGVAANYQSLVPSTIATWPGFGGVSPMFTNLGDKAFNSTDQGNFRFGRISLTSIHGSGQVPGTGDYRAIVAYTIQEGEAGLEQVTVTVPEATRNFVRPRVAGDP